MATSVLQDQQYVFGIPSLLAAEKELFVSGLDSSQHHSLHQAFSSLLTDRTSF